MKVLVITFFILASYSCSQGQKDLITQGPEQEKEGLTEEPDYLDEFISFWDLAINEKFLDSPEAIYRNQTKLNQSFCYLKDNQVLGNMPDQPVSLASVSKVYTTLWALDLLGPNHRYQTTIYLDRQRGIAHIESPLSDPVFGSAKMFWLISILNDYNVYKLKRISFHENFVFFPETLLNHRYLSNFVDSHGVRHIKFYTPTIRETINRMNWYMNTENWNESIRNDFRAKITNHLFINTQLRFELEEPAFQQNQNPFVRNGRIIPGISIIKLSSSPLHKITKFVNTHSTNAATDLMFYSMGDIARFKRYLKMKFGEEFQAKTSFVSGSGLPYSRFYPNGDSVRELNKSTCANTLKVFKALNEIQKKHDPQKQVPFDFLPLAGPAPLNHAATPYYFVGKTGSLNDTSAIAGILSTQQSLTPIALLNSNVNTDVIYNGQITSPARLFRMIQRKMMEKMVSLFGGGNRIEYRTEDWINDDEFTAHDPRADFDYVSPLN